MEEGSMQVIYNSMLLLLQPFTYFTNFTHYQQFQEISN